MPRVVALFRHPVKGFTPERLDTLQIQSDGRVAGDRVLAFRFADAAEPEEQRGLAHWPKSKGLALQDFPTLAALDLSYDDENQRVRISHHGRLLAETGLDAAGRTQLAAAVTQYVLDSSDNTRLRRPGRLPLVLVGDGERARFQDRARGYVSVHSTASVAALAESMDQPLDDRRFRSNIVIDGVEAWDELDWDGQVRIGDVTFAVEGPIVRCLATHANPDTGVRDAKVLTALTGQVGLDKPTLGRLLLLPGVSGDVADESGRGGVIHVGDEITIG